MAQWLGSSSDFFFFGLTMRDVYCDADTSILRTWCGILMVKHTTIHNCVQISFIFGFFVLFYFVFVYVGVCSVHFYRDWTIFARHHVQCSQHGKHLNNRNKYQTYYRHRSTKRWQMPKNLPYFRTKSKNLLNHVRPVAHPNKFQQVKL